MISTIILIINNIICNIFISINIFSY